MAFWLAECGQGSPFPNPPSPPSQFPLTDLHHSAGPRSCCLLPAPWLPFLCCGHIKVVSAAAFILIWKLFPRPGSVPAPIYAFSSASFDLPTLMLIIFAWLLLDFYYISRPHCVYAALYNCHRFHYNLYMACYITRRGFIGRFVRRQEYRWWRQRGKARS